MESTSASVRRHGPVIVAAALAVVLASLLVLRTTSAAYTASTGSPGNNWNSGTVVLTDDDAGSAMFASGADGLLTAGQALQKCLTVTYNGSLTDGIEIRLYGTGISGALADDLALVVEEGSGGGYGNCAGFSPARTVYTGTLGGFAATATGFDSGVGGWPAATGASTTYRVTVTVANDNATQGKAATGAFTWAAQEASVAFPPTARLVVLAADGGKPNGLNSTARAWSANGRYLLLDSNATNLTGTPDPASHTDVFVLDTSTGDTTHVSVTPTGAAGNFWSEAVAISADGRYVAFRSRASDLVAGDTNNAEDAFVRDMQTGTTTQVSTTAANAQVSGTSRAVDMSDDGRYVLIESNATTLVAGDTNAKYDVFVKDTQTGAVTRISTMPDGTQIALHYSFGEDISPDGRYVLFSTPAALLAGDTNTATDMYLKDRTTGTITLASGPVAGHEPLFTSSVSEGRISADGRYVIFTTDSDLAPADTNDWNDVYRKDLQTGDLVMVTRDKDGGGADDWSLANSMSADGRYVVFESYATDLTADSLVPGSSHVFVKDMQAGTTRLVSENEAGVPANERSVGGVITPDGDRIAFQSYASNLHPDVTSNTDYADFVYVVPCP